MPFPFNFGSFFDIRKHSFFIDAAFGTGNKSMVRQAVLQHIPYQAITAVYEVIQVRLEFKCELVCSPSIKIISIDDTKGLFYLIPGHPDSMPGAPGLGSASRGLKACRQIIHFLEDIINFNLLRLPVEK